MTCWINLTFTFNYVQGKQDQSESAQDDLDDPAAIMILENETDGEEALSSTEMPFYKLVSQAGGNIQLCLETDEVQVYTGDATRYHIVFKLPEIVFFKLNKTC